MNNEKLFLIEFPTEGCVNISDDETILEAALSAGIPLFHICGGNARCSTCRVLIIEGADHLKVPNAKELLLKNQMNFPPNVRLACQTKVTGGPVKLRRIIHDETDIGLYVGNAAGTSTQHLGEENELVLFFLDIRDFTPFVESLLAFDVIHIIRKLFSMFQNVIESNGGKIIETAGDGIYAVFNCQEDRSKMAQSSVQSAFSIIQNIELLNQNYFSLHFGKNINVGIGIHIGKVISGSVLIGSEDHTVVMGLPVNIAARLQSVTKEINNNIVVSKDIFDLLLSSSIPAHPILVVLKGVAEPLTVFPIGNAYQSSF